MKLGNDEPVILTEDKSTSGTIGCMFIVVAILATLAKAFGWI